MGLARASLPALGCLGVLFFCRDLLRDLDNGGFHDWGIFYFHTTSAYRSLVDFHEIPLWNPWCLGGMPILANPQTPVPDPWFGIDLIVGPIAAIRFKIVIHYLVGLVGMYWCGRRFGLSRLASAYSAGTWILSTWLALRVQAGHYAFLCGVYLPWVIGSLQLGAARLARALLASLFLALMAFEGGVFVHIVTFFLVVPLMAGLAVQRRSMGPILALTVAYLGFFGIASVKLLPSIQTLSAYSRTEVLDDENRRVNVVGGRGWEKYRRSGVEAGGDAGRDRAIQDRNEGGGSGRLGKILELGSFCLNLFLRREQRAETIYYSFQGLGWHEYGCYVGPLAVVLCVLALLLKPSSWPWMLGGLTCMAIGAGNFGPLAPWTLLHRLPILSNMRASGRFLIPVAFVACMVAGMVLDRVVALCERVVASGARRGIVGRSGAVAIRAIPSLLVVLSLVDSFLVGRRSLEGAFPYKPSTYPPRRETILTVEDMETGGQTAAVVSNYCTLNADEALPIPIRVVAEGQAGYRGELYFERDSEGPPGPAARVDLVRWTPNTVRVRVEAREPGTLVLNRNWSTGWTARRPYEAAPREGLISAHVATGEHVVEFVYQPVSFTLGAWISAASLLMGAYLLGRSEVGGRRRRKPEETPSG